METSGGGILGRVGERVLSWIALGLVALAVFGVIQMGPVARGAVLSAIWRTGLWLVIVAGLPWIGQLFIGRLLEVGTNWVGVILLAVLTLIDIIAGISLLTAWPVGFWTWFAMLAILAVAAVYNYLVAEYLAEQAGG
ncbi:MAG: hypothetical protein JXO22_14290 [Phycisphaerae bacterium]|nr:hypothetical protein [Phycisphaerae bacterium]